ncbi:8-amino-7-oxononanoate synthase [Testudinibacter sp. TR-2022]|uniref:8-amino-7-oxononanoate synthase n=1 Tax=Testudinibacter sp. TR-2022 TaxID=2585029 RepID=UPI0011185F34|nr:8-amino-7-oxononanoate synthase [Testudinibacter sp. TR-2022]TNH04266.1 8-amino-7-oxononanoate synthase [Pasteurellaceae bacterium Phil31]TNH07706.1 8-amino-7-oxononanoate synthase [Testudinibacter sp. TR-2022]TNH10762.1 8-amino-7-oxononanoate synthase [Testudinibacter sp. TR-2022]TNH16301.1 8-amino-7-oxononanoate synthase [Testudinibacter sp. TR-2022]TNH19231.1 8-amino-7-oxononanoate synthase [Testudinibacter sp. TR-2022]
MLNFYAEQLAQLQQQGQYRTLPDIRHQGKHIWRDGRKMLNFSSNDYLGLASDNSLKQQFFAQTDVGEMALTSSSSRLLTGNFPIYAELESVMASQFQREACLLFNSGYHANIGILPTLADKQTLILADKLVHASLIDGIRLSEADYQRYRHNDYAHLQQLLEKNSKTYQRIIIVTESVFSMDGDTTDLWQLVALKQQYRHVMLYVDEAHALGVFGQNGLGLAEKCGCIEQIDFLVGTFGKALAAMGAYVVCDQVIKDYLINKMRPLIFSTALSPLVVQWVYFLMQHLPQMQTQRQHLQQLSTQLQLGVQQLTQQVMPSRSQIVPYILGDNASTVASAERLQQRGFYCLPIRPPTVPSGTSRIRFSLTADMTADEVAQLLDVLKGSQ